MSEFFLEIFSEEVPARMQAGAMEALEKAYRDNLAAAAIPFGALKVFSTPRRLGIVIDGLADMQQDRTEEFRGPKAGAPDAALQGFLKSRNITLEQCVQQDTGKGVYWTYTEAIPGRPMSGVLADMTVDIIDKFAWPKSMRWSTYALKWVRPLLSVVAVFKGATVPFAVPQTDGGIVAGNTTIGHRFLAPAPITVRDFADYRQKTRDAFVLIDRAERRSTIIALAEGLAAEKKLTLRKDEALLDELTGLVEWPSAVLCAFDKDFLDVPQEALIASMRGHQKYLSLLDENGTLSNSFIVITNMTPDGARRGNIVSGNEKVLRARLSDARFFWDQDRAAELQSRNGRLKDIVFHAKLGTLDQKVARLENLAVFIAGKIGAKAEDVRAAAQLCKSDLVTAMVGEFPELQGVMGMHYARQQGANADVARAIAEHYKPAGPQDGVPSRPVSMAVALADKIDTLAGFFAIGEKPTGSKDPYALRRAALGVIRIVLAGDLPFSMEEVFAAAVQNYADQGQGAVAAAIAAAQKADAGGGLPSALRQWGLFDFILDRLKQSFKDGSIRPDVIEAVFSRLQGGAAIDIARLQKRTESVQKFILTDVGGSLVSGYKRAANIVRAEGEKDKAVFSGDVSEPLLKLEEERALFAMLADIQKEISPLVKAHDYARAMTAMAALQKPVDAFFDNVTVNDNDPAIRLNRLNLLARVQKTVNEIADFSCLK